MAADEQHRQVQTAIELDQAARTLTHSTRDVPSPIHSYRLLAELGPTVDHLQQIVRQLSALHRRVTDGQEYSARTRTVTGDRHARGRRQLEVVAAALLQAGEALGAAHAANGVVWWMGE